MRHGQKDAAGICRRYLDLQIRTTDQEELRFCRQLYQAMQTALVYGGEFHE